jgi:hypothetical protein
VIGSFTITIDPTMSIFEGTTVSRRRPDRLRPCLQDGA